MISDYLVDQLSDANGRPSRVNPARTHPLQEFDLGFNLKRPQTVAKPQGTSDQNQDDHIIMVLTQEQNISSVRQELIGNHCKRSMSFTSFEGPIVQTKSQAWQYASSEGY